MAKYKVVTKCFGYQGRMWEVGTIVDAPDKTKMPPHFQLVGALAVKVADGVDDAEVDSKKGKGK